MSYKLLKFWPTLFLFIHAILCISLFLLLLTSSIYCHRKSMNKIAGLHKKDLECVNIFQNKKFEKIEQ